MELHFAALWFVVGVTAHYLISKMMGMYYGVILFQEMEKFTSLCAVALVKDTRTLFKRRLSSLKNSGQDAMELEKLEEVDKFVVSMFEQNILIKMYKNCPKHYRTYLKYSNWKELEEYANEHVKGSNKER